MKKQRKPIILVLVLAALCGGAAVMNKPQQSAQDQQNAQPKDTPKEEDKSKLAGDVSKNMAGTKPNLGHFNPHKGMPGANGPALLKPDIKPFKPKPSDSATSTHWYDDESARKAEVSH
jgi:hypothetical protein